MKKLTLVFMIICAAFATLYIINPPEVAILGISKSIFEPIFIENKLKKRLMLPFSISYDHRVIDGVDAAEFTKRFGNLITNLHEII